MQLYIHIHICTHEHFCPVHQHNYTGYMSKLPDYQCTPGLLPMVMVRPLKDQRTHFNSSSSKQILHSDRLLWTCLYPKHKMVVSLKGLQDSSRGTKLVCVRLCSVGNGQRQQQQQQYSIKLVTCVQLRNVL